MSALRSRRACDKLPDCRVVNTHGFLRPLAQHAAALQTHVGRDEFEVWFAPLQPQPSAPDALTLLAPSQVYADYLRDHHMSLLVETATALAHGAVAVTITTQPDGGRKPDGAARVPPQLALHLPDLRRRPLQPVRAGRRPVGRREPRRAYNPLFIYAAPASARPISSTRSATRCCRGRRAPGFATSRPSTSSTS